MDMVKEQKREKLVLLDAHAILHRAYHALPDFSTASGQPTGALYGLSTMLIKIIEDLKPDYVIACYDLPGPTYRHEAFKEYKAQRKKADDDLVAQMKSSRDIFHALNIPIYDKPGFEADDMLGTIVEQVLNGKYKVSGREKPHDLDIVIASGDMDTMQLIKGDRVKVYTLKKGIKDTIIYNEKAVIERFGFGPELIPDYKGLRGDPSDNIPGVKGIGEKTATILIKEFGTIEKIYEEVHKVFKVCKVDASNPTRLETSAGKRGASKDENKNETEALNLKIFTDLGITPRIVELLKNNEEEALFSKMLAIIRRDVPIEFVLPEKKFTEGLDMKKVNVFWHQLEFRTLGPRLEKAVGVEKFLIETQNVVGAEKRDSRNTPSVSAGTVAGSPSPSLGPKRSDPPHLSAPTTNPSSQETTQTSIALWLLNSNITKPTIEDIINFIPQDTDDQAEAFAKAKTAIFAELDKKGLRKVYEEIELPLIPIIEKMRKRGVKIDRKMLNELGKTYHAEVALLEKKIWEYAGQEFNISSPKQLGEILFDKLGLKPKNAKKTSGGARSTKESELEKMRDMHPMVPLIFEYRELTKLLSTYIDAIPPLLDAEDRLHAQFLQTGTTTGRMGCQDPNLQNIPIKTELGRAIRKAFVAGEGFKLCAFDYSQVELRIAAFMSGDENMIDIFRSGEDFHKSVAARVFGVIPEDVTPEMRRHAKTINFGIIYGMGVTALKQSLGTSREVAQKFYNDYFKAFPGLAKYLDNVKVETAKTGYTETFFGRRRYFEGIRSKFPFIKAAAERMAINAPIQGTGADIVKLAMIKIEEFTKKEKLEELVYPLMQVHDELVYEVRADRAEEIAEDIREIMQGVMTIEETRGIVLESSSVVGDNWGELK